MPEFATGAAIYIARMWIPKLIKMLGRISGERKEQLDRIALDFTDPQELARYYVEPNCQRLNPANLPDGEHDEFRRPVFEAIDRFLQEPSMNRDGGNHKIVLGDAGMGKSSLLVMLWNMHLFGFWPKDVECTLLKLGRNTLDEIAAITAPARHILLLDALDEDPSFSDEAGGAKARLVELIRATTRFRKVIISCRTQFFVDEDDDSTFAKLGSVRLEHFTCPIIYLSPFDDEQAKELLQKRFPNSWSNYLLFRPNKAREKAASIAEAMGSLNMRPLLLSYISFLIGDDPNTEGPLDLDEEEREYEIYRLLITRWLDREVLKIRERGTTAVPSADQLREICWQVATNMMLDGVRKMPRASFDRLRQQVGAPEFLADSTLEGRALLNKDSAGNFRFAHYSIQEFLVVECCLNLGVFVRSADSKYALVPSALMQRFYEQRLRANLRSRILESMLRCASNPDRLVTRAALTPSALLFVATKMIEFVRTSEPSGTLALAFGERDWSEAVWESAASTLLRALEKVTNIAYLRTDWLESLDGEWVAYVMNMMDGTDRTVDRTENVDVLDELGVMSPVITAATAVAAQLAAGLLNFSFSEDYLIRICRKELQKAWPVY